MVAPPAAEVDEFCAKIGPEPDIINRRMLVKIDFVQRFDQLLVRRFVSIKAQYPVVFCQHNTFVFIGAIAVPGSFKNPAAACGSDFRCTVGAPAVYNDDVIAYQFCAADAPADHAGLISGNYNDGNWDHAICIYWQYRSPH